MQRNYKNSQPDSQNLSAKTTNIRVWRFKNSIWCTNTNTIFVKNKADEEQNWSAKGMVYAKMNGPYLLLIWLYKFSVLFLHLDSRNRPGHCIIKSLMTVLSNWASLILNRTEVLKWTKLKYRWKKLRWKKQVPSLSCSNWIAICQFL